MARKTKSEKMQIQTNEAEKAIEKTKERARRLSNIKVSGSFNAALSILSLYRGEDLDACALFGDLKNQLDSVLDGNTRRMEIMLMTQAQTLNSLFHFAVARISHAETLPQINTYTDLAMKANNNCRKSLLALNQIKNPASTTFIKQQNNAVNQQINNSASEAQVSENSEKICVNELLLGEVSHAKLDTRSESSSSKDYSPMAAMEKSRRKNSRRKSHQ